MLARLVVDAVLIWRWCGTECTAAGRRHEGGVASHTVSRCSLRIIMWVLCAALSPTLNYPLARMVYRNRVYQMVSELLR